MCCDDRSHIVFFNDPATTEIYTLSLHDALPICVGRAPGAVGLQPLAVGAVLDADPDRSDRAVVDGVAGDGHRVRADRLVVDRKSTRLNSSHANISYAVFCLKKKIDIGLPTL